MPNVSDSKPKATTKISYSKIPRVVSTFFALRSILNHFVLTMIEKYENDDETSDFTTISHELNRFEIDEAFIIDVGEEKEIPFHFHPDTLNFKSDKSQVYLNTHVYIDYGVDEETEAVIPYHR
ncbi:sporulation protein [Staphylococcus pseudintermedius]|nr:sporulation protein [Staphylococcus pseudintermedius]